MRCGVEFLRALNVWKLDFTTRRPPSRQPTHQQRHGRTDKPAHRLPIFSDRIVLDPQRAKQRDDLQRHGDQQCRGGEDRKRAPSPGCLESPKPPERQRETKQDGNRRDNPLPESRRNDLRRGRLRRGGRQCLAGREAAGSWLALSSGTPVEYRCRDSQNANRLAGLAGRDGED